MIVSPSQPASHPFSATFAAGLAQIGSGLLAPRISLRDFFPRAWPIVNPGIPYISNWHNDLIAEHLELVHQGEIKLLDIEMPPRFGKSFHVSCAFGPWEWTEDPSERFLFSSYNQKLCNRHSLDRRAIIQSAWYRSQWGGYVQLAADQNLKGEFQNTARGHMITIPFGSSATGSGGRRLIVDDPINPKQAASKVQRETAHEFYTNTLSTRLDDEVNSAIIIVAQRTDVDDVQGRVVSEKDGWVRLKIPIEARSRTVYVFPISKTEKIYERGEILCPARKSKKGVDALRKTMGRAAAAQLDQEPEQDKGNLFPREHWKQLRECPTPIFTINFWDTAVKEKDSNDPSAGVCVVLHANGFHVCKGITREWLRYGALKIAVRDRYQLDKPDAVGVEDKSSGQQITQDLQDEGTIPVVNPDPDFQKLDKNARAALVQPLWQAGKVSYDPDMEGAAYMIEEFAAFKPGCAHDDVVDAVVHAVHYLKNVSIAPPEEDHEVEDHAVYENL